MKFDLLFTWHELSNRKLENSIVAVADVLRATTVMIRALQNGARAVMPQPSEESARDMYTLLNEQGLPVLLCGEKDGLKREGYDLGNSPREFTAEAVNGKTLIQLTTNGTRALSAARHAKKVFIAAFSNMSALASRLKQYQGEADEILFVVSGREGMYCLEDAVCLGGVIANMIEPPGVFTDVTDAARTAVDLYHMYQGNLLNMVNTSVHGRYLDEIGLGEDLPECVKVDTSVLTPEMKGNRVSI